MSLLSPNNLPKFERETEKMKIHFRILYPLAFITNLTILFYLLAIKQVEIVAPWILFCLVPTLALLILNALLKNRVHWLRITLATLIPIPVAYALIYLFFRWVAGNIGI